MRRVRCWGMVKRDGRLEEGDGHHQEFRNLGKCTSLHYSRIRDNSSTTCLLVQLYITQERLRKEKGITRMMSIFTPSRQRQEARPNSRTQSRTSQHQVFQMHVSQLVLRLVLQEPTDC